MNKEKKYFICIAIILVVSLCSLLILGAVVVQDGTLTVQDLTVQQDMDVAGGTLAVDSANGRVDISTLRLIPSTLPGSPQAGDIVIDQGDNNKLKWYDPASGSMRVGVLNPVTEDLNMGNFRISNIGSPTTDTDAVSLQYANNMSINQIASSVIANDGSKGHCTFGPKSFCVIVGTNKIIQVNPDGTIKETTDGTYGTTSDSNIACNKDFCVIPGDDRIIRVKQDKLPDLKQDTNYDTTPGSNVACSNSFCMATMVDKIIRIGPNGDPALDKDNNYDTTADSNINCNNEFCMVLGDDKIIIATADLSTKPTLHSATTYDTAVGTPVKPSASVDLTDYATTDYVDESYAVRNTGSEIHCTTGSNKFCIITANGKIIRDTGSAFQTFHNGFVSPDSNVACNKDFCVISGNSKVIQVKSVDSPREDANAYVATNSNSLCNDNFCVITGSNGIVRVIIDQAPTPYAKNGVGHTSNIACNNDFCTVTANGGLIRIKATAFSEANEGAVTIGAPI